MEEKIIVLRADDPSVAERMLKYLTEKAPEGLSFKTSLLESDVNESSTIGVIVYDQSSFTPALVELLEERSTPNAIATMGTSPSVIFITEDPQSAEQRMLSLSDSIFDAHDWAMPEELVELIHKIFRLECALASASQ